ncbi:MAG: L-threonylcarbamoyladenylate synthase [Deltaproteobacteria bacterium]|nr:L-threonylcarbamoyladenylate synthase [Deltaproteobacteria bacterium]
MSDENRWQHHPVGQASRLSGATHPSSLITIKVNAQNPDEEAIRKACAVLKQGGILAFPTETFYGLGADALNEQALKRVFALKQRDYAKPLLVIISEKDQLHSLVSDIPSVAEKLMDSFWPGPLTIIFKARKGLPSLLTGGTDTVGIRISSHPVARSLASTFGLPLTATSANLSGGRNPITAQDVCDQLGGRVDMILDAGETKGIKGSTIIDVTLSPPRIVREGDVPVDEIMKAIV